MSIYLCIFRALDRMCILCHEYALPGRLQLLLEPSKLPNLVSKMNLQNAMTLHAVCFLSTHCFMLSFDDIKVALSLGIRPWRNESPGSPVIGRQPSSDPSLVSESQFCKADIPWHQGRLKFYLNLFSQKLQGILYPLLFKIIADHISLLWTSF
jgi:hypothetical protein